MRPLLRHVLLILTVAGLSLGCSGSGSSPTAPKAPQVTTTVSTQWGAITVSAGNCGSVDTDLLVDSVTKGYNRARDVAGTIVDSVLLTGLTVEGVAGLECMGTAAYGCYYFDEDHIQFRCDSANVMEHELQHRFCDQLDRPCDCYMIDHSGGFDLNCQPT